MSLPTCFSSDSANVMQDLAARLLGRDSVLFELDPICCALAQLASQQERGLDSLPLQDIAGCDLHLLPGDPPGKNGCGRCFPEDCIELEQLLRDEASSLIAVGPVVETFELPFVLEDQTLYTRKNYLERKTVFDGFLAKCPEEGLAQNAEDMDFAALSVEFLEALWNRRVAVLSGGAHSAKEALAARYVLHGLATSPDGMIRIVAPTHADVRRFDAELKAAVSNTVFPSGACYPVAMTVHKALGLRPDGSRSSKTPPIATASCVVVLAAHRIDLPMFAALMKSIPAEAKLLLVGDPKQEMGGQLGRAFSELVVPIAQGHGCYMEGRHQYALPKETSQDCRGAPEKLQNWNRNQQVGDFFPAVQEKWAAFRASRTPEEALKHLNDFHVLCEDADGPFGAKAFNDYLQRLFDASGPRLYKVNVDDPLLGISHWDIAVQMPDDPERFWLPGIGGGPPRCFATALLPSLEPAWALTVKEAAEHSFGSCFAMLRADNEGNVYNEILYAAKDCCRDAFQLWKL